MYTFVINKEGSQESNSLIVEIFYKFGPFELIQFLKNIEKWYVITCNKNVQPNRVRMRKRRQTRAKNNGNERFKQGKEHEL